MKARRAGRNPPIRAVIAVHNQHDEEVIDAMIASENWLYSRLKLVHRILDIPYPIATTEIRGRAVEARMIMTEILATFTSNLTKEQE